MPHPVLMAVVVACLLLAPKHPAHAFKWHACPAPPLPVYPSAVGATSAPFIHPGHSLTIVLNEAEVAASGGFSTEPAQNTLAITFRSLFGPAIPLPPRQISATSEAALSFDFPETQSEGFGILAGPVEILVTSATGMVALISAADLVALPPTTDVTGLILGTETDVLALAAIGADGDVWIPTAFHGKPMYMPMCPGTFLMPMPVQVGAATVDGPMPAKFNPLERIRSVSGYLGDMDVDGVNFYGWLVPERIALVHTDDTLGVSICRLNDAMDLVLRVRGDQRWALPKPSPFRLVASESRPLPLLLHAAAQRPGKLASNDGRDSFGNVCIAGAELNAERHHRPERRQQRANKRD
jgi:hypothetical protein